MINSNSHQASIIITPPMLKQQIIIRMNTLINKAGGKYYDHDVHGMPKPLTTIEDVDVYGVETNGRDVYLMAVVNTDVWNPDGDFTPYNANEFFLEQLWNVYLALEPIYESKFNDYANFNQD
jgi:hypothetical protein